MTDKELAYRMLYGWLVALYVAAGMAVTHVISFELLSALASAFLVWFVFVTWAWRER